MANVASPIKTGGKDTFDLALLFSTRKTNPVELQNELNGNMH